jgi:hypothetical protein
MNDRMNHYPPYPVPSLSGAFVLIGLLIFVLAALL